MPTSRIATRNPIATHPYVIYYLIPIVDTRCTQPLCHRDVCFTIPFMSTTANILEYHVIDDFAYVSCTYVYYSMYIVHIPLNFKVEFGKERSFYLLLYFINGNFNINSILACHILNERKQINQIYYLLFLVEFLP